MIAKWFCISGCDVWFKILGPEEVDLKCDKPNIALPGLLTLYEEKNNQEMNKAGFLA